MSSAFFDELTFCDILRDLMTILVNLADIISTTSISVVQKICLS